MEKFKHYSGIVLGHVRLLLFTFMLGIIAVDFARGGYVMLTLSVASLHIFMIYIFGMDIESKRLKFIKRKKEIE